LIVAEQWLVSRRAAFMKERPKTIFRRRDLLGVVLAGAGQRP
jgi:hypothetical protein